MATKYTKKPKKSAYKKIQDTEGSNFGKYSEDTGGGKPFSTSNTRTTRENGEYRQANNDTKQPRTDDGKFTYKSVNGKSINPEYGPSRGKTVNPLLTGGENGIYIEDIKDKKTGEVKKGVASQFAEKSGEYWDKYKDKWYRKGSEVILGKDTRTRVAGEDIWEIARQRYDKVAQEFGGKIEWDDGMKVWVATEEGKESDTFKEVKKGRKTEAEKAAATTASKTGEQTFVSGSEGEIAVKPGTTPTEKKKYKPGWKSNLTEEQGNAQNPKNSGKWKPKMATPTMTTEEWEAQYGGVGSYKEAPAPTAPTPTTPAPASESTPAPAPAPTPASAPASKYNQSHYDKVVDFFSNKFSGDEKLTGLINKFNNLSPAEKEKQIDNWISKGVNFGF